MLDRCYAVKGLEFMDGSVPMIECSKRDGVSLCKALGFKRTAVERFDVLGASVCKAGCGKYSAWTGRRHGDWEVAISHRGGLSTFLMKSEGEARHLAKWINWYVSSGR